MHRRAVRDGPQTMAVSLSCLGGRQDADSAGDERQEHSALKKRPFDHPHVNYTGGPKPPPLSCDATCAREIEYLGKDTFDSFR